jgi:hypothetical protein
MRRFGTERTLLVVVHVQEKLPSIWRLSEAAEIVCDAGTLHL